MIKKKQLTVKQALKKGYEHFLYAGEGFQSLHFIKDIDEDDWGRGDIVLVHKEPTHPVCPPAEELAEMIATELENSWEDETGDDTSEVYEMVKAIDFTDIRSKIAEVLLSKHYYRATDIKLVK